MLDKSSPFASPQPPFGTAEASYVVAIRRLRRAIVTCELAPGAFVGEADLVARFALGRAAVRVALTELAAAKFVSRHARQGWRVAPVNGALSRDVLAALARLEPVLIDTAPDAATKAALIEAAGILDTVIGRDEPQAVTMARAAARRIRELLPPARTGFCAIGCFARGITPTGSCANWSSWDMRSPWPTCAISFKRYAMAIWPPRRALRKDQSRFADALARGFLAKAEFFAPGDARSARRRKPVLARAVRSSSQPLTKDQKR